MPDKQPTAPAAKGIREPLGGLLRRPALFFDPMSLSAKHWRRLIGQAPVVSACVQTLIMQITGLQWTITAEEEGQESAAEEFTQILNMADNGGGFESLVARVIEDSLTVPFGGAIELGPYPDGQVAWIAHLDGALMSPTYDEKYPYMQSNPYDPLRPAVFKATEVARIMWQPQSETSLYGWTKTPCMACLSAIQGLLRSDRFWQTLLTDSPPAGILDIPGMTEEEARDWLSDWKTMMAGIDSLKVPILTGEGRTKETGPTQFISFGSDATQVQLPELLRRYSEQVCAAFGMNTSDLGLFGQEMRLAGMSKIIELSKRQGLARLLKQFERVINTDVLPEGLAFKWEDMELEDTVRREAARKMSAERLAILANPMAPIITLDEARRQAAEEKLITVEGLDVSLEPEPPSGNGDKPKSDEGVTTTGEEKGDQAGARASPKGVAPHERGASTEKVPPRAYPANSEAAKELGTVIGPWIRKIGDTFTLTRLGALYDAALAAYLKAPREQSLLERTSLANKMANEAVEAILATENYWLAPDIVPQVERALAKGYEQALVESAQEMQEGLYNGGFATTPQIPFSQATLTDPATLAELKASAGDLIRNVDDGTKFYVKQSVMAGVKEGLGSKAIARKMLVNNVRRGVIEKFRGRALSIVNTEMNKAMTSATLAQQNSVGLKKKRWKAVGALACEVCVRNQDKGSVAARYKYESVWGGSTIQGPPAHPHVCHCWITHDRDDLVKAVGAGEPNYWQGTPHPLTGPAIAPSPFTSIDDWTPKTFRKEFRTRFDTDLAHFKEAGDLPWTLEKAQKVARVWETMPTPPRAYWASTKNAFGMPLKGVEKQRVRLRIQPLRTMQGEFQDKRSAYYWDWHHEIILSDEYAFAARGENAFGRFGMRGGTLETDPWDFGREGIAHELGHAYAYAKWGDNGVQVAEVGRVWLKLRQKRGMVGWKWPSDYGTTKASEMLAESWAWLRADAAAFKARCPEIYNAMVEWFGWSGNLRGAAP